jgi:hypothetical protein
MYISVPKICLCEVVSDALQVYVSFTLGELSVIPKMDQISF